MKSPLLGAVCAVVLTFVTAAANAGLIGRLETYPGSGMFQAFYDDQLDITWLADGNAAVGSAFDDGFSATDGRMTWASATEWASSLNINGLTGWRLPNMDINGDDNIVDCLTVTQAACRDNEYGHLFYYGAGTTLGGGLMSNQEPFSNVQSSYWSSTENTSDPASAWIFSSWGMGAASKSTSERFAWAARSGDVGPPTPPSTFIVTVDEPDFKFNATADPTGVIGAIYQNGREWDLEGYNHSAFILGSPVIPIDESQIRLSAVDWSASPAQKTENDGDLRVAVFVWAVGP